MALYKYSVYFEGSNLAEFDVFYTPGTIVNYSGIYRCEGCGKEVAANKGDPLPPQNHHQHTVNQGAVRWKLICAAKY